MAKINKRRRVYKLVGESHYQPALRAAKKGAAVALIHEPTNIHDPRAVRAQTGDGSTIGYLARADAEVLHSSLDELESVVIHRLTGGVEDYPTIGCELWLTWPGPPASRSRPAPTVGNAGSWFSRLFSRPSRGHFLWTSASNI